MLSYVFYFKRSSVPLFTLAKTASKSVLVTLLNCAIGFFSKLLFKGMEESPCLFPIT